MTIIKAAILGIIQGLCEFLPVSSSGHLVLAQAAFGLEEGGLLLTSMLHIGTLAAVFWVYWRDIVQMIKRPFSKPVGLLLLASIPALIAALLMGDLFDDMFAGRFLGVSFILTGLILLGGARFSGKRDDLTAKDALAMGVWQAVAILPGVSRSGSTISGGVIVGLKRESAARFSFLMSIPAILGSLLFQIKDIFDLGVGTLAVDIPSLAVGMLFAAVSGYAAIRFMLRLLQKASLLPFAVYTFILGALVIADQTLFHVIF